jgi:hypothetical protein
MSLANEVIPRFLWNPKFQYRIYKYLQLVPILNHINPVHTPPTQLIESPSQYYPHIYALVFQEVCLPEIPSKTLYAPLEGSCGCRTQITVRNRPVAIFYLFLFAVQFLLKFALV